MQNVGEAPTSEPAAYPHSSYRCNALGAVDVLISPHVEYLELGRSEAGRLGAYRELVGEALSSSMLDRIRNNLHRNLAL